MQAYKQHIIVLLKQLLLVFFMYFLCRLFFFVLNQGHFTGLSVIELFKLFFFGIRFDAFSISVSNALYILISVLPFVFANNRILKTINHSLFIVFNSLFILANCIDFAYYPFNKKRSTFDIINQLFGGQTDVGALLPTFFKDYWYVVLIYGAFIFLFIKLNKRILKQDVTLTGGYTWKQAIQITVFSLSLLAITFISFRGLARVPIQLIDAGKYATAKYVDMVINTPLSILLTMDKTNLTEIREVDEQMAYDQVKPIKQFKHRYFNKKNVVVIILESFSKEYTWLSHRKSYTPFLDSLMQESLVFQHAIANAGTSIEGIPSIVSSFPNLMPNPYINSTYSGNKLTSLASVLREEGYQTSFFHGGTNGTMNFDSYAHLSGFENYYGRSEYNNEKDFDGNWGIWDEAFLQYTSNMLSTYQKPFFAAVFTLSSHHPFKVPEKYAKKFPKSELEIIESIGYTDYSLRQFFETAKKTEWYQNTLFVLTPDHTSISNDAFYNNDVGHHQIPLLFFNPTDTLLKGSNQHMMQQIDIMPSILDYLGYHQPFFSFGNSIFENQNASKYAIYYNSGNYFLMTDSIYYVFNHLQLQQVFNYKQDSLLTQNKFDAMQQPCIDAELYLKAYVQFYNKAVINNKTH